MSIDYIIGTQPENYWPENYWPIRYWPKAPIRYIPSDDLYHTPSLIMGTFLVDEGIISSPIEGNSWPLYISHLPDGQDVQDNAGAIYDTTPLVDARVFTGLRNTHYGLQIKIRAIDYETGRAKIAAILSLLQDIQNREVSVNDFIYSARVANPSTGIFSLGIEQGTKRRYLFTLNFLTVIKYLEVA